MNVFYILILFMIAPLPHSATFLNTSFWNFSKFLCLHSVRSMEMVEKTELLRRLSFYALSKIHLDRYGSFCKILFIFSWNENLNLGPVHGIQNENLLHVLPFHDCKISRDGLCYAKMWADWLGCLFKKEEYTLSR